MVTRTAAFHYPCADALELLTPVLLNPVEPEKLEPLDLLPLLELPDEETDAEMLGPVLPPELENPGPLDCPP